METRIVRDFKNGIKVFFITFVICSPIFFFLVPVLVGFIKIKFGIELFSNPITDNEMLTLLLCGVVVPSVILSTIGFIVNYTPLKIKDGNVIIPATDQIRTFLDLLIVNPITGLYRRRVYRLEDIENVANGYTRPKSGNKNRKWNVVITGVHNGRSFSQRIDVSNKQVRDEVRNALKHTISGRVNSEFSY